MYAHSLRMVAEEQASPDSDGLADAPEHSFEFLWRTHFWKQPGSSISCLLPKLTKDFGIWAGVLVVGVPLLERRAMRQ